MKIRIASLLTATAFACSACAQDLPPPPAAGQPLLAAPPALPAPIPLAAALPPLPPGCIAAAPPAPQPPAMGVSDAAMEMVLGLNSSQATRVRQVYERQAAQQQRLDQQRQELDASTCRSLRDIVGDQELARWWSMLPPPPAPGRPGAPPPPPPPGLAPPPIG